jgi:hypothetical protein
MTEQDQQLLAAVQADLPNFPAEVIEIWLLPFARELGWPPERSSDPWTFRLRMAGEGLEYWRSVTWELVDADLAALPLADDFTACPRGMYEAYVSGVENAYAGMRDRGGMRRYMRVCKSMLETGLFPRPIIMRERSGRYDVVDGNHRYLAWSTVPLLRSVLPKLPQERASEILHKLKEKWGIAELAPLSPTQPVWIGREPQGLGT